MSSSTRRWHSLLISFSIVTWALAQPLYGFILGNHSFDGSTGSYVLLFVLLYHGLPLLAVFLADRAITELWKSPLAHRLFRSALFVLATSVFLRIIWLSGDPLIGDGIAVIPPLLLAVLIFVVLIVMVIRFYHPVTLLFIYLSIASVVLTGWFTLQIGLLGDKWDGASSESPVILPETDTGKGPVFLVIFDGLGGSVLSPEGQFDPALFPHFSALAKESAVFTNATSNYLTSKNSIRSLMTGEVLSVEPTYERRPSWSDTEGILRILADEGHRVEFHDETFRCQSGNGSICNELVIATGTSMFQLTRDFVVWFLPKPVSRAGRDFVLSFIGREASLHIPFDTTHRNSQNFWDSLVANVSGATSPGRVYFVHILLPHQPYEFDRTGNRVRSLNAAQDFDDFPKMAQAYQEQVEFVDNLLGKLVTKLKSEDLYDQSMMILTGDHGPRSLGLGKKFSGFQTSREFPEQIDGIIPSVLLLLHGPGIRPEVSQVDYQHIDLLPTVLDVMGLPTPQSFEGVSAFAAQRPIRDKVFYGFPSQRNPGETVAYVYDEGSDVWRRK